MIIVVGMNTLYVRHLVHAFALDTHFSLPYVLHKKNILVIIWTSGQRNIWHDDYYYFYSTMTYIHDRKLKEPFDDDTALKRARLTRIRTNSNQD